MKKGFTLIELLGAIIVLATLLLLTLPSIINFIKKGNDSIDNATLDLIYNGADMYIRENQDDFIKMEGAKFCISLKDLVDSGNIKAPIKLSDNDQDLTDLKTVQVEYTDKFEYSIVDNSECESTSLTSIILDRKGYTQVEYIESDGKAYIRTDYTGQDNYQIDCDMQITGAVNSSYWFGQTQAHGSMMFNGLYSSNKLEYNWKTISYTASSDRRTVMTQTKIDEETVRINFNGQVVDKPIGSNDSTGNFLIFACNNVRLYGYPMRLYSFRMHDGNTDIMNLIPCYEKSTGTLGVYDIVNDIFYSNAGSGLFSKGADVTN